MNIIEAVTALKNGECKGITRPHYSLAYVHAGLRWSGSDYDYVPVEDDVLADDWELVGPKPLTEEREVVRWAVLRPDNSVQHITATAEAARQYITAEAAWQCINAEPWRRVELQIVELRGTYTVEIPRPAKKRVTGRVRWMYVGGVMAPVLLHGPNFDFDAVAGKTGTLTFEED